MVGSDDLVASEGSPLSIRGPPVSRPRHMVPYQVLVYDAPAPRHPPRSLRLDLDIFVFGHFRLWRRH